MKKINSLTILIWLITVINAFCQTNSDLVFKKEIKIKKGQTYLNFPVRNSERLVKVAVRFEGKPLDIFTINLANEKPDFWVFMDVAAFQGKTLTIEMSNPPAFPGRPVASDQRTNSNSELRQNGLNMVFADVSYPGQDSLYLEKGRPEVHFTANRGWINDPNGLIWDNNEYHLYFQHNPYGWQWGNMHWGHAVSHDLVHWEQLKDAIYPFIDENPGARSDAAFSGSAVKDPENTAGFRRNGIDPLIAVYTSTGRGECLKLSYDNGRTFEDFPGNPVLKHNGRDPKVFWYEPGKHWVMVVWESGMPKKLGLDAEVRLREHSIYSSTDLKSWTYQSGVSGFFECPELFSLPVEGESGVSKWIMYDANGRYIVGDFDGKKFKIEQHFTRYENGGGYFYASQTYNNSPDGRRIQIGWGRNITNPGLPFNQPMLFPTELKLKRTQNGYRLCPTPVKEIETLHGNYQFLRDRIVKPGESAKLDVIAERPLHILVEITRGDAPITLSLLGYELRYDNEWIFSASPTEGTLEKPLAPAGPFPAPTASDPVTYVSTSEKFKVEAIIDKNILEFYINDGELYYATAFIGKKQPNIELSVTKTQAGRNTERKFILDKLEVFELNNIWKK